MKEEINLEERAKIILDVEEDLKSLTNQLRNFKNVSTQLSESKGSLEQTKSELVGLINNMGEFMSKISEVIYQLKRVNLDAILDYISCVEKREKKLLITVIILLALVIAGIVTILVRI